MEQCDCGPPSGASGGEGGGGDMNGDICELDPNPTPTLKSQS